MRTAILNFLQLISPQPDMLGAHYNQHKNRKKTHIINGSISACGNGHRSAFQSLIIAIKGQAILATVDPNHRLCLFTDASEPYRSDVLTHVTQREFESGKAPKTWNTLHWCLCPDRFVTLLPFPIGSIYPLAQFAASKLDSFTVD